MIIKKFQAETETEAMVLVKEELGRDAIVMNIKKVRPKGIYKLWKKPLVEVTAATDDDVSYSNEQMLSKIKEIQENSQKEQEKKQAGIPKETNLSEAGNALNKLPVQEEGNTAIEQKLNNLQVLLENQLKSASDEKKEAAEEAVPAETEKPEEKNPCVQLIFQQLRNNEVDEKYANQIVSEIDRIVNKDATIDHVLSNIYQKLVLKLGQPRTIEVGEQTKYIFFVGPTGVGKTTTIAKIASSIKLESKARIALVTADTYRIAAVEQLKTYANILGIPLKVVYTENEMKEVQEDFGDYDLVLIDTAGRSYKNKEQQEDIESLIRTIPIGDREVYLVLSATTKYGDLVKIAETYKKLTDYSLIFTKLDETSFIGNILNIRMLTDAPLSYATWGQNVPDDIGKIDAQDIAKQLLGGNE